MTGRSAQGAAPAAGPGRPRLQIRVSVDEHMPELYGWLRALPSTVRGRELLAQARLARVLAAGTALPPPARGLALGGGTTAVASGIPGTPSGLSEEAGALAAARLKVGFVTAVPPLDRA